MKKLLLHQILVFTIHGKTKDSCNNNKFKISAPTWNDKIELPVGHILYQIFKLYLSIF